MHSLRSPLFLVHPRCSFALRRERTHQGDGLTIEEPRSRMNTQNVNIKTAAHESSRKMVGKPLSLIILVAENETGMISNEEWDVMEFSSLAELQKMRRRHPEKMKGRYFYALSSGVDEQFSHVHIVEADHFKQFERQIKRKGISI